jgi:dihydrofolate synthase / folylpolyglutamate synthase
MDGLAGLAYLRTFPDFELGNVSAAKTFGLERVLALLDEVGSPNLRLPVIHIAGTKGKGSTAASIAAITRAAGYRTGLFTQPHLVRINERFQIDGVELDNETLTAIMLDKIQPAMIRLSHRGIMGVQQFEAQVALAMLWFESRGVDVAVLEVGLGGRLDGTNVVPRPMATTLTAIGFDHVAILGNTLSLIAAEKAAIVKPGVPAVASPQLPEVESVFIERCRAMGSSLILGNRDWQVHSVVTQRSGTTFDLQAEAAMARREDLPLPAGDAGITVADLHTPLLGAHQAVNAGTAAMTALSAARVLRRIDVESVRRGLASVVWPGRLQILDTTPTVVLDGAHTPESAAVLVRAVQALFPAMRVILICGIQADKDIPGIVKILAPLANNVIATRAHHPRAAQADAIAAAFRATAATPIDQRDGLLDALALARSLAGRDDLILVTGSLYVVGEVLAAEQSRNSSGAGTV